MTPADRRGFARALTKLADAGVAEALNLAHSSDENCRRIGITGPPGAGKSSLIAQLAHQRLRGDGDLAIIAIDPTSPVSGGAILGDRIRMEALATDPRIYIRSLATRMSLDGLADNLPDILGAVDRFGFSEVMIETVGVGQVEYAIRALVDTVVLVMPPGAGDQVQAMKSGILEKADICVINKADQPGARQLAADIRSVLKYRVALPCGWAPQVLSTTLNDAASVAALSAEIDRHQDWALQSGAWAAARTARRAHHVGSLLGRRVTEVLRRLPPDMRAQPVDALYNIVVQELAEPRRA